MDFFNEEGVAHVVYFELILVTLLPASKQEHVMLAGKDNRPETNLTVQIFNKIRKVKFFNDHQLFLTSSFSTD